MDKEMEELKQKLKNYTPLLPDTVLEYFMEKNGIKNNDDDVKKLISAMGHKFLSDVAVNAFQFHKITTKSNLKDKRFSKEKKITLTTSDLEKALDEIGLDVSRPHYFS